MFVEQNQIRFQFMNQRAAVLLGTFPQVLSYIAHQQEIQYFGQEGRSLAVPLGCTLGLNGFQQFGCHVERWATPALWGIGLRFILGHRRLDHRSDSDEINCRYPSLLLGG